MGSPKATIKAAAIENNASAHGISNKYKARAAVIFAHIFLGNLLLFSCSKIAGATNAPTTAAIGGA